MKVNFTWDDKYCLGNSLIDGQHKMLVELANAIPQANDMHQVRAAIFRLYKHTREHFSAEEALMREVKYPQMQEHILVHDKLITDLNAITSKDAPEEIVVSDFKTFVYKWVIDHLMNHDKELIAYIQQLKQA